jgi:CRP/FNR family transcriptional regulator, cyclic AMP receptor protein
MRTVPVIGGQAGWTSQTGWYDYGSFDENAQNREECRVYEFPSRIASNAQGDGSGPHSRRGEFFRNLSTDAINEFESITVPHCCPGATVLIREEEEPSRVLFLLEGRVKLSMNSIDGRRLILAIAWPGEILGLTSAVSGCPHAITAETQFPCMITSVQRQVFLGFLMRYPMASQNVMRELSLDYERTAQQLRTLGLASTAPAKFARLLLEWCKDGEETERGVRIQCPLTHGEIGEHIGASRETISRVIKGFKSQGLVEQCGSILIVPDIEALEAYEYAI